MKTKEKLSDKQIIKEPRKKVRELNETNEMLTETLGHISDCAQTVLEATNESEN